MLARVIQFVALAVARSLQPKPEAPTPDRTAELEARLAETEAKARSDLKAEAIKAHRSRIAAQAQLDQIEARIRDADDTRETLLRVLAGGPSVVPKESLADLPGQAAEYLSLVYAGHGYAVAIRELDDLAGRLGAAQPH